MGSTVIDWRTFDSVAATYDEVRPGYPIAVFDAISAYGQLSVRPDVLEIGVGTGQATLQMVGRGWDVVGVEPGPELAAIARARLAGFARTSVLVSTFEAIEGKELRTLRAAAPNSNPNNGSGPGASDGENPNGS
jgi:SAM-dependent methyltransferase